MQNYLFIITGPSGCGKTTLLKKMEFHESTSNRWNTQFWEKAEKYSTRDARAGEKDHAGYSDVHTPLYDIDDSEDDRRKKKESMRTQIIGHCDVIYYMNNELYGFSTEKIKKQLERRHVAIVLSDLGVIKTLKTNADFEIVTVYISSCVEASDLTEVWHSRYKNFAGEKIVDVADQALGRNDAAGQASDKNNKEVNVLLSQLKKNVSSLAKIKMTNDDEGYNAFFDFYTALQGVIASQNALMPDSASYQVRIDRLKNFYYKYIIDIGLFDYVILNYFDKREDDPSNETMTTQAKSIIDYIENENKVRPNNPITFKAADRPRDAIFFVCAAPKSGKNILMKNLRVMSEKQIMLIDKQSLRPRKYDVLGEDKDALDKMHPIIEQYTEESKNAFAERRRMINAFVEKDKAGFSKAEISLNGFKSELSELIKQVETTTGETKESLIKQTENVQKKIEESTATIRKLVEEATTFFDDRFKDWVWRFHGIYYGIDTDEIEKYSGKIRGDCMPVIMISNMDQLDAAIEKYENRLVPIFLTYVGGEKSNGAYHHGLVGKVNGYDTKAEADAVLQEIETIRDAYFEHIGKFRHVLLNSGVEEDLHDQIINIIRLYEQQ